jgi:hypothetical protein
VLLAKNGVPFSPALLITGSHVRVMPGEKQKGRHLAAFFFVA